MPRDSNAAHNRVLQMKRRASRRTLPLTQRLPNPGGPRPKAGPTPVINRLSTETDQAHRGGAAEGGIQV